MISTNDCLAVYEWWIKDFSDIFGFIVRLVYEIFPMFWILFFGWDVSVIKGNLWSSYDRYDTDQDEVVCPFHLYFFCNRFFYSYLYRVICVKKIVIIVKIIEHIFVHLRHFVFIIEISVYEFYFLWYIWRPLSLSELTPY